MKFSELAPGRKFTFSDEEENFYRCIKLYEPTYIFLNGKNIVAIDLDNGKFIKNDILTDDIEVKSERIIWTRDL